MREEAHQEEAMVIRYIVGLAACTQDIFLGTPVRVVRGSDIKRMEEQDKWMAGVVLAVQGTTQQLDLPREGEDISHMQHCGARPG